jgi:hypothetical protein
MYNGFVYEPDIVDIKSMSGFVYLIKNKTTGISYIGKKAFWSCRKLKPTDKRRTTVQSAWRTYLGSNKEFAKSCENSDIERTILHICRTKYCMSYHETKLLFQYDVLNPESKFANDNISGKYFRKKYTDWLESLSPVS